MPDPKKNSSISSFKAILKRFGLPVVIFFIPVVIIATVLEVMVGKIPSTYSIVGDYLNKEAADIEVAVFGSSQIKNSVDASLISKNTLNISSSAQHHNTDFELLKGLVDRLPNLKTVVFEVSYGHFEIPHNSKYYWKRPVFLKYYGINTFDRATTPADSLLYMSHPGFFTKQLLGHYVKDSLPQFNRHGFELNNYKGRFKKLNYDLQKILNDPINISRRESKETLAYNAAYFKDMLAFCNNHGLEVVIISPPTFANYNEKRDQNILKRRDSTLQALLAAYPEVRLLISETDPRYMVTDFRNGNHLNPDGAEKFTKQLDSLLNTN
ncbi:hypothetical protein [Gilvibacter sediminis]|uniref:hypothetical protein n=1 Tax=Gilvibacter sediminis TaxID=379071 RepID=UPI00235074D0|nr:hypothetical protein [Gilvibacter sediminis]MDC7999165.1 hypothetical protein [Gilvibacter sediminis]